MQKIEFQMLMPFQGDWFARVLKPRALPWAESRLPRWGAVGAGDYFRNYWWSRETKHPKPPFFLTIHYRHDNLCRARKSRPPTVTSITLNLETSELTKERVISEHAKHPKPPKCMDIHLL